MSTSLVKLFSALNVGNPDTSTTANDKNVVKLRESLESTTYSAKSDDILWAKIAKDAPFLSQFCLNLVKKGGEMADEGARVFLGALSVPGCDSYGVFDNEMFVEAIKIMKAPIAIDENEKEKHDTEVVRALLKSVSGALDIFQFREHPDAADYLIDALIDLVAANTGDVMEMALQSLGRLNSPEHDGDRTNKDTILRGLLPVLLGLQRRHRATAGAVQRSAALDFVCELLADESEQVDEGDFFEDGDEIDHRGAVLIQQICVRVPDKQESRQIAANTVSEILSVLPAKEVKRFSQFLEKLAGNTKIAYRTVAVDVSARIAGSLEVEAASIRRIVGVVMSRLVDKAVTVRSRALAGVATLAALPECIARSSLIERLGLKKEEEDVVEDDDTLMRRRETTKSRSKNALDAVLWRVDDERPMVRRAAVAAVDSLLGITENETVKEQMVAVLAQSCRDAAVSARKQALGTLTRTIEAAINDSAASVPKYLVNVWFTYCASLVADPEPTVVDKCLDAVHSLIISRIANSSKKSSTSVNVNVIWDIIASIDDDALKYIGRAATMLHKAKPTTRLGPAIVRRVITSLSQAISSGGSSSNDSIVSGMLAFLNALSAGVLPSVLSKSDAADVMKIFDMSNGTSMSDLNRRHVLVIVAAAAAVLRETDTRKAGSGDAAYIASILESQLLQFDSPLPHTVAQAAIAALGVLDPGPPMRASQAHQVHGQALRPADLQPGWCHRVLDGADKALFAYAMAPTTTKEEDVAASTRLFAVSETLLAVNAFTSQRLATVVQALTADQLAPAPGASESRAVPVSVRAHALVALGKMCLLDATLAKSVVASLARLLIVRGEGEGDGADDSADPVIRNNAVVVLADLCMKHTALVDPYLPTLSACFSDPSPLVRRQAIALVTRLVLQDYVRWKGTLFFRFAFTLADPSPSIREFASSCLLGVLRSKWPRALSTLLVEMVFVLNNFTGHETYNQFDARQGEGGEDGDGEEMWTSETQSDALRQRFSLCGDLNIDRRMAIYESLLKEMQDDQRFQSWGKLAEDVLAAATDGSLPAGVSLGLDISEGQDGEGEGDETIAASNVLADALRILSSPSAGISTGSGNIIDQDEDTKEAALLRAKGKLLTSVLKRHVADNIVPIVVALRRGMQQHRSPLLRELNLYLRVLVSQWKNEVVDALTGSADASIVAEVEADLAQEARAKREKETVNPNTGTPTRHEIAVAKGTTPRLRRRRPEGDNDSGSGSQSVAGTPSVARTPNVGGSKLRQSMAALTSPVPVPSPLPVRVYAETPLSAAPGSVRVSVAADPDAIYMYPPDEALPGIRKWGVSTPADSKRDLNSRSARRKRRAAAKEREVDDEDKRVTSKSRVFPQPDFDMKDE